MRNLNEYSQEELKRLYKSYTLYVFTFQMIKELKYQAAKYGRTMVKQLDVDDSDEKKYYSSAEGVRFFNLVGLSTIENNLMNENIEEKEKINLINKRIYLKTCNEVIYWYGGEYTTEWFEEFHMNDDVDRDLDRATLEEIYIFIWETLRFCSTDELKKLLEYADKKFEIKGVGRPSCAKKIYKYDKENNLLATYANRAECVEKEGNITKNALSMHLAGKRCYLRGFVFKEI